VEARNFLESQFYPPERRERIDFIQTIALKNAGDRHIGYVHFRFAPEIKLCR